jgi:hypothetical protein
MTEHPEVEITIPLEAQPTGADGRWEVVDVVDPRDGASLGDIGIYDFDADSDFVTDLERAVLKSLTTRSEQSQSSRHKALQIS